MDSSARRTGMEDCGLAEILPAAIVYGASPACSEKRDRFGGLPDVPGLACGGTSVARLGGSEDYKTSTRGRCEPTATSGELRLTFSQSLGGYSPACIFNLRNGVGGNWQGNATSIQANSTVHVQDVYWSNAGMGHYA